jgi:hypothetical protein
MTLDWMKSGLENVLEKAFTFIKGGRVQLSREAAAQSTE